MEPPVKAHRITPQMCEAVCTSLMLRHVLWSTFVRWRLSTVCLLYGSQQCMCLSIRVCACVLHVCTCVCMRSVLHPPGAHKELLVMRSWCSRMLTCQLAYPRQVRRTHSHWGYANASAMPYSSSMTYVCVLRMLLHSCSSSKVYTYLIIWFIVYIYIYTYIKVYNQLYIGCKYGSHAILMHGHVKLANSVPKKSWVCTVWW